MRYLRTNTATRITVGPFLDKTDGITPEVAITVTSEKLTFVVDTAGVPTLILDTAPTASGGANDMVHITGDDSGFYDLELATADVNYLGRAMLSLNDVATHLPVFHEFMILPAVIYDAMILGTDLFDVSMTQILDTAVSTPATAGILDINVKNIANAVVNTATAQVGVNTVSQANIDFGALQKTSLNAATPASVVGAVGSVTGGVTVTTNNDKTGYSLSAAAIQAIWDGLTSAFTTVGSIGKKLADWVVGTIDTYTGNTKQTGDAFARLGAPAGASVSADIAAIEAQTDDIGIAGAGLTALGDTRIANLDAAVSTRATPAQVNTEVLDVINTDAATELATIPTTTGTLRQMVQFLFQYFRNKKTVNATTETLFKEDAITVLGTAALTDDAVIFTKGETN